MKNKILDKIKQAYCVNPERIKSIYLFCVFATLFLFSPFINTVLDITPIVNDFSTHIISDASINDFDISSRIRLYFSSFLLIILFSSVAFVLFFNYLNSRYIENNANKKSLQSVFNYSLIGIVAVFAGFFNVNVDMALTIILFISGYLLLATTKSSLYWDRENAFWILVMAIPFSFIFFKIIQKEIALENDLSLLTINEISYPVYNLGLVYGLILLTTVFLALLFLKFFFKKAVSQENYLQKRNQLYFATLPVSFIVLLQSLFLELFNVLNLKYDYVFKSPRQLFLVLGVFASIASVILYFRNRKKEYNYDVLAKYHFPLLIIGITMIIVQPWRMFQPENEFFEFANHGLALDHFFRYGSIPIIENFDAHMFSNQFFAYLYGFISGYEPWAPFLYSPYVEVIYSLLIYFVFRKFLGSKTTLLFLLCFPFIALVNTNFTLLCWVALALNNLIVQQTKKAFYWFWLSILINCLFRLDIGFLALVGGLFGYFLVSYLLNKEIDWKRLFLSGTIVFGSIFILFIVLCLFKGVHPILRLKEFLIISSSNQNFAYKGLGETTDMAFRICYYFLPIVLVLLLLNVIFNLKISESFVSKILKSKKNQSAFVFFIFFGIAYLLNLPRGIVRHSYLENILTVVVSCLPLALLSFIYIKKRKNNLLLFLLSFVGLFVLTSLNVKSQKDKGNSLLSKGLYSPSFQENFTDSYSFNGTRTRLTINLSEVKLFEKILNTVLKPKETYFDFSSNNYYHALVGRKNPVYVNQSPILLNGDVSQITAINQIKKADVALVIMPNNKTKWKLIDLIETNFKYYLISEYIYQNFVPLKNMNSFDIFVRKDKKKEFEARLRSKSGNINSILLDDFSSLDFTKTQNHNVVTEVLADKSLVIKNTGEDPFVFGLWNQINGYDLINKNAPVKISFKTNVSSLGIFQLYYQLPGDDGFKEENSKRYTIDKVGENNLELELPYCPVDLRLDLELPQIKLKKIEFLSKATKGYQQPDNLIMNLFELPRVWGERADQTLFDKVPVLENPLKQSSVTMVFDSNKQMKKPCYFYVDAEALDKQVVAVELYNAQNQKKSIYYFNTKKGKHQYAIRLSTDYSWWNDSLTKLTFSTSSLVTISKFAIISFDGNQIDSYHAFSGFMLSGITDENWQGGIGTGIQSNQLLFDNTKKNAQELNSGNYIVLSDGSKIKIDKKVIEGDFIKVFISENLEPLKPKLQNPNTLKIVK